MNDDLGTAKTNPVVLIATHERKYITCQNIESLLKQSLKPKVVLVVSTVEEYDYYRDRFINVEIIRADNIPLGYKWQSGVNACRLLKPDPLIITGSDDILGVGFIQNMVSYMMTGCDFVGLNKWWMVNGAKAYQLQYNFENFPLGGGRAYSKRLLEKLNYNIFDFSKDRHLDDKGWNDSLKSGYVCEIVDADKYGLHIVSIKGGWETMNPAQKILTSNRIKILQELSSQNITHLL